MEPVEGAGRERLERLAQEDGGIRPVELERTADLLEEHRLPGGTDREMDLATGGEEHFQQPHRVGGAGGAGDRQHDRELWGGCHVSAAR